MTDRRKQRAVLYARKSTKDDDTAEQSKSVADQLRDMAAYAKREGWEVVDEFKDDGRSGRLDRSKRPGLDQTLRLIESGGADVLLTWWSSRLSRSIRDQSEYVAILKEKGVAWHVPAEGGEVRFTTAMEKAFTNQRALWNEFQSDQIRDNWMDAHRRRIERGLPKTSNPQFGYDYTVEVDEMTGRRKKESGEYVVNEAEGGVVKELYRRYTRGDGFTTLVVWLNENGWRVKGTGNQWTVRTLNRWMDVGFTAGFISREAHLRDAKGSHEILVTEDQWLAYRAERERRAPLGKANGSGERWWLAGLVKCGECGGSTYIGGPSVCCTMHRSNPTACSGCKSILRDYVEGAVGLWLGPHLDLLDQLVGHESREVENAAGAAWATATAKVEKIEAAIGKADAERLLEGVDNRSTIEHLRGLLTVAKKEREEAASAMQRNETFDLALLRNGEMWDADRRAALAGVLDRVEVHAEELRIYPIVGEPTVRTRADLAPRCGVSGCGRVSYTQGLCKSHTMRARKVGAFDALVNRVRSAEDLIKPTRPITNEEVEAVLRAAHDVAV